jgi:hypothetical protein
VLLSLLVLFLIGCSEKTQNDNPGTKIEPTLDKYMHNGRLVFNDQETYHEHLNWILLNQSTPDVIRRFNSRIGLVSMKEIYDDGMELVDNHDDFLAFEEKYPRVFEQATYIENSMIFEIEAPPVFAYLANEDGLFQVGKTIYRVSYNHTIEIVDGDETKIPLILSYDESIKDPSIRSKPTSLGKKGQLYYRADLFDEDDKTKRMVSRHWESIVAGLYTYRVNTTGQSRVLGIWWQKKLYYIEASWDAGYYRTCYYHPLYCNVPDYGIVAGFHAYTDKADIDIVFRQDDHPILLDVSYCYATHRGQLTSTGPRIVRQADALEDY